MSWSVIDFTGSTITDIEDRKHNDLQTLQGGTSNQYYHLTSAQYSTITSETNVTSTAVNTTLGDSSRIIYVTADGVTVTLPAASAARVGQTWTVILATDGEVIIAPAGADTIILPTSTETTVGITTKGNSLTFCCLNTTTWGMI